ncbi:MAG TPA: bacterial Ig-like domain-containing protein [Candidatus Faecousia excrementigallinarum]|uniref:Bacterial Ig-like domain-containing protein n=1 Tax=Candidatus Faecousia excrementigallinarum TaxID=2840806 RepID=A0A9D0Z2Z6_9FIRM|nr:bacterial Ig-like domain-containing protein [Candidatus Faecousia excrementigallinarum]
MKITWKKWGSLLLALALVLSLAPPVQAAPAREETVQSRGEKIPVALAVAAMPDKLTYMEYTEELDVTGGQIKVYWNDGTSEVMDMTREMVTGFDNTKLGTQTLTVTYGQASASFQVEVVAKTAQSIAVTRLPDKLTYLTTYEELDVTGGEITVTYADGTPAKVIPMTREMVTGFDNTQLGPQTLTVTYAGAETTYEVEIVAATLTHISVSQLPEQTVYLWNVDSLNLEGAVISLHFNNNTTTQIPMTREMVTGFDNTQAGPQTLTVTYQGETATFQVAVEKNNTTQFASGLGTKEWPYIILTKEHLNNVRLYLNGHFKMMEDIVFTEEDFEANGAYYNNGQGWEPIGAYRWDFSTSFTGTFDGDGHTITGLKMNLVASEEVYAGLFGYIKNGTVTNLGMVDSQIQGESTERYDYCYAGGIAGYVADGTISNCRNTGEVTTSSVQSFSYAGGIAGRISGSSISNCCNTGGVTAKNDAGGIAGWVTDNCTIISCRNTGEVTAEENAGGVGGNVSGGTISSCSNTGGVTAGDDAGGIVGYTEGGTIQGCANGGEVTSSSRAGGIVGSVWKGGTVSASCNTSAVLGRWAAGGIVCHLEDSAISGCYNTGDVSASRFAGGVSGQVGLSTIRNCYNNGAVSSRNDYAGGISAYASSSTFSSCYNTGAVLASSETSYRHYAGGIAGYTYNSDISFCYFLDTAQRGIANGGGETTACTWEAMKKQDTFQGFDFETAWTMEGIPGYSYPELTSVIAVSPCETKGHTTFRVGEKAPTYTSEGYTGDIYCLGCGLLVEQGRVIPVRDDHAEIYRIYNPGNGKHHYTMDASERDALVGGGWIYEGIAWKAPKEGKPIYRVYNPGNDNHLYTMDSDERDRLVKGGWQYEGILCYSFDETGTPLYRVCNPYVTKNPHHYTDSLEECDFLESNGWRIEGISWYGLRK